MAKPKINYTELAHQVVQEAEEPLALPEIMERVKAIVPITTKKPQNTIRNILYQSRLIMPLGDGRYGWKPRLITGSVLRLTLSAVELAGEMVALTQEVRDALWPSFFEIQKRRDVSPVQLELPDGTVTPFPLMHVVKNLWGSPASPEFWTWFNSLPAVEEDHLIFTVLDGMARRYRVAYQPAAARDEAAIAARNLATVEAIVKFMHSHPYSMLNWEIIPHLLVTGHYRHPVPPDPLNVIWPEDSEELDIPEFPYGDMDFGDEMPPAQPISDAALSELFGAAVQVYDYDRPPDLPREYDPSRGLRRPRPSAKAKKGLVKTYTFRVNHRALPQVWRDIELAEDQTLEDLHLMIQTAYEWGDDHLYSFFLGKKAWDQSTEIGCPWSDTSLHTHQVQIDQLQLRPRQKFIYLFDYGDSHEFEVRVLNINPNATAGKYPKIVGQQGQAPPQYPDYDEEEWQ